MRPRSYHSAMDHARASVILISNSRNAIDRVGPGHTPFGVCGRLLDSKNPLRIYMNTSFVFSFGCSFSPGQNRIQSGISANTKKV